jgi:uncharacterized protein (DUF2147 family)
MTMKRLVALAALVFASSTAQAQYTFDFGGRTIRVDPDRGTVSVPGVYDNTARRNRAHGDHGSERPRKATPKQAKVGPSAPTSAPVHTAAPPSSAIAPIDASVETPRNSTTTPLGLWLTQEKKGKVRIEQCGANFCGYSVDTKSNQNGMQVLINIKPGGDARWTGRILDPDTDNTYESIIVLQGSDTLRIQGCAMGAMFCSGQTWSRLY